MERAGLSIAAQEQPGFVWPVRVYYEDTDSGGIVYYANYLRFFERARTEWLRSLGLQQETLKQDAGLMFVVRRALLDFVAPARLDEQLSVSVRPQRVARSYVDLAQEASCQGQLRCAAEVRIACLRAADFRPAPMPDGLRRQIFLKQ
jgi:acyl-CoA thioester hydrolase